MLDAIVQALFQFLCEVVGFGIGRAVIVVVTMGRKRPKLGDSSQPLVSLLGGVVLIVTIVGFFSYINGYLWRG
jgi:hypothetical protein